MADCAAPARLLDEAVVREERAADGARGPGQVGVAAGQMRQQLLGAPGGVMAAGLEDGGDQLGWGLVRRGVGATGAILQAGGAQLFVARGPFIAGLTADVVECAEFCEGEGMAQEVGDELSLLVHR